LRLDKPYLFAVALCEALHSAIYQDGCVATDIAAVARIIDREWHQCKEENDFGKIAWKIYSDYLAKRGERDW
jgi:hypothetical protein